MKTSVIWSGLMGNWICFLVGHHWKTVGLTNPANWVCVRCSRSLDEVTRSRHRERYP